MNIVDTFEEAEFPPVLSRAIEIKDVSLFEGVAQCHVEYDIPLSLLGLVPAWQRLFGFWTIWFLVEMLWMFQNKVHQLDTELVLCVLGDRVKEETVCQLKIGSFQTAAFCLLLKGKSVDFN